jgi:hypothetical protein
MNWHESLPPAEAQVPCGTGSHTVRWTAGQLAIPAHPDGEAEAVLAALGGDRPLCVEVADTWAKHADDLDVLIMGPRSRSDKITSGWGDVRKAQAAVTLRSRSGPLRSGPAGPMTPQALAGLTHSRTAMLRLLALGPAFQFRLAGAVAAAWSAGASSAGDGDHGGRRPELAAALTGRLAPAVAEWLGIDPDSVTADPLERSCLPGWGTLETFGRGSASRLRASLPIGWLAWVWACGLAVVDGHLVVAVERPGWPRARVRALREPGATAVQLDVVATDDAPLPHWAISA